MMVGRNWRHAILVGCLVFLPASLAKSNEDPVLFQQRFSNDSKAFMIARGGLQRAAEFARSHPDILNPGRGQAPGLIPRQQKLGIWNTWNAILDWQVTLDAIRRQWRGDAFVRNKEQRDAAFSMTNAAFLASYRYGLEIIALADANPDLDTILNEPVPELGLPEGTYDRYKARFLNANLATEFSALQVIDRTLVKRPGHLRASIGEDSSYIWKMGKGKGHVLTVKNATTELKKTGLTAVFPVQRSISEWMGDTKVYRKGRHLISADQIEIADRLLQPGDIFFERHEWYLSNLGLPGFWTHAAFYIGTVEERKAFFADPEVQAWVRSQGVADGDFEKLLQAKEPGAYTICRTPQEEGHLPQILEAVSEGVSFTTLERTGESDSMAVVRPRLSRREKAQALLRAFHYSGRPYDFNFDFETDSSLVCSELIYKAYEPGQGMQGLRFPMSEVMGRKVSAPNAMVQQFDEQSGNANAQCEFVLFLDGFEKEKRALESTSEQFRKSWRRPNWHVLVQAAPAQASKP